MASLKLNHIYKVYPNGHKAVTDFNIDIKDKEFIVFVGPSGCGKSTTLRMIAGLEEITAGELYIDDLLVNDIEPMDRDIAMVFQNYALYPHMSVYDNMAFGLRNRKVKEEEIKKLVLKAAKVLDIEEYLDRKPKEMSGGQRQRVALGRAIVRNPKVFLLDEPLSNLDAKLRSQMRSEITKLHKKLETTFIYVTHDQVEAMTMGTRIVVMKGGYVQQIDTPMNLYNHPKNKFVAGFIGTPQMNFFNAKLLKDGDNITLTLDDNNSMSFPYSLIHKINPRYLNNEEIYLGIRAEDIHISKTPTSIKAKVNVFEQLGTESLIYATLDLNSSLKIKEDNQIIIKVPSKSIYNIDDIIYLNFDIENAHFFNKETEETLIEEIPTSTRVNALVKDNKLTLFGKEINLPNAYSLIKDGNFQIDIPSNSFIKGNTYSLEVLKKEKINDNYLLTLKNEDGVIFSLVNEDIKTKDYNFSLDYSKLTLYKDNKLILDKVDDEIKLKANLIKEKVKVNSKQEYKYYLSFNSYKLELSEEKVNKILTLLSKKALQKEFKIVIKTKDVKLSSSGIEVNVIKKLDYNNVVYLEVSYGDTTFKVLGDDSNNNHIIFEEQDISIFLSDINMRIC